MELLDDLKQALSDKKVLIVAGAGVTISSVDASIKHATWKGLIENGLRRALELGRLTQEDADYRLLGLALPSMQPLLDAAEVVADALGQEANDGEFANWLDVTVGKFVPENRQLLEAMANLHKFGIPISTTNYDSLLSGFCGVRPILLQDIRQSIGFLQGEINGILHLHGHFESSISIVLG